ncbi:MAG: response regulator [Asticcacaulis sp.]|uniref:ATP-binding protein n=1 Tax=Asticcacaulis sp. TaxID=1872648 RepID=UPI0039E3A7B3
MNSEFSQDVIRLFDQSPTFMVFLKGPEHRFELANPAYMALVGERKLIGLTVAEAIPEAVDQGFLGMLDDVFKSGEAITARSARYDRVLNGATTELYVDFVYQPIIGNDGQVSGILAQGVDVTQRTQAEQALIEARNAAEAAEISKADFLSHLSHNIRAPMNAVVGLANILTTTQPLSYEQGEYLHALLLSAESVLHQVSDMVDTARIEAHIIDLDIAAFSPAELVAKVAGNVAVQAREKGLSLDVEILCDEDEQLMGDAARIGQILNQLASNAIQFTEDGGLHFTVATESAEDSQRRLTLTVSDTGVGMPAGKIATLFRPSVDADTGLKRRYGGTGLGLSIARTLCEIMGGTITAESTPGEGSRFTVRLPLASAESDGAETTPVPAEAETLAQTDLSGFPPILLVEDYEPNILVATTFLERLGYRVEVAMNGLSAVEKARTGVYALALMDVQMPGITGIEATRMIREEEAVEGRPYLPIIGVTAHSLAADRDRCLEAGMDEFLPKPFNAADLHEKMAAVLSLQKAA